MNKAVELDWREAGIGSAESYHPLLGFDAPEKHALAQLDQVNSFGIEVQAYSTSTLNIGQHLNEECVPWLDARCHFCGLGVGNSKVLGADTKNLGSPLLVHCQHCGPCRVPNRCWARFTAHSRRNPADLHAKGRRGLPVAISQPRRGHAENFCELTELPSRGDALATGPIA